MHAIQTKKFIFNEIDWQLFFVRRISVRFCYNFCTFSYNPKLNQQYKDEPDAVLMQIFSVFFLNLIGTYAQSPQSFNYQAVAWDNAGDLMKSTSLTVRISIFSESETGTLQWEETHNTATNEFGVFTLKIDAGTKTAGSATEFSEINWGSFSHFLKVEVDAGSGYNNMGTTQLL